MQIIVIAVGRLKRTSEQNLCDLYLNRLKSSRVSVREVEERGPFLGDERMAREGELLLRACTPGAELVALDRLGREMKSEELAEFIEEAQIRGQNLNFIIGGANGISKKVLKKSNYKISLGKMTWPHALARVMLLEQLYRAQQILAGHPYHRN